MKKKNYKKKSNQSNFSKLSIFNPQKYRFKKKCPLSGKTAPVVDYKNTKLLKIPYRFDKNHQPIINFKSLPSLRFIFISKVKL